MVMAPAQLTLQKRGPHPGTGDFIKDYMQRVGEDYIYNTYRAFCKFLENKGQQCSSYASFRTYFYVCTKMDLIEFVREEPVGNLIPRRYYRLVKRNLKSKSWANPRAALDLRKGRTVPNPATGEPTPVSKLGRRRYRRWVKRLPPQPIGRPKKTGVASS